MLTAQIISIVAFCVSWLWYVTLILGAVAMVLLQVIWCCRMKKSGVYASFIIAALASIGCIIAGVIMIVQWKGDTYCHVFTVTNDNFDDDFYDWGDYCKEQAWAAIAFITGTLWATTAGFILYFVTSGRYERCELRSDERNGESNRQNQENPNSNSSNVEMGVLATAYATHVDGIPTSHGTTPSAAPVVVAEDTDVSEKV